MHMGSGIALAGDYKGSSMMEPDDENDDDNEVNDDIGSILGDEVEEF